MKKLGFVFFGAVLIVVVLAWSGYGGSTMDEYLSEKDGGQTLTVLENKTSARTIVIGMFTKPQGYYFVRKSGAPAKGRYTRDQNAYNLKDNDGKESKLTVLPDSSLRDESGVTWLHKTHAESDTNVEKNRATCQETQGKNCPY